MRCGDRYFGIRKGNGLAGGALGHCHIGVRIDIIDPTGSPGSRVGTWYAGQETPVARKAVRPGHTYVCWEGDTSDTVRTTYAQQGRGRLFEYAGRLARRSESSEHSLTSSAAVLVFVFTRRTNTSYIRYTTTVHISCHSNGVMGLNTASVVTHSSPCDFCTWHTDFSQSQVLSFQVLHFLSQSQHFVPQVSFC